MVTSLTQPTLTLPMLLTSLSVTGTIHVVLFSFLVEMHYTLYRTQLSTTVQMNLIQTRCIEWDSKHTASEVASWCSSNHARMVTTLYKTRGGGGGAVRYLLEVILYYIIFEIWPSTKLSTSTWLLNFKPVTSPELLLIPVADQQRWML